MYNRFVRAILYLQTEAAAGFFSSRVRPTFELRERDIRRTWRIPDVQWVTVGCIHGDAKVTNERQFGIFRAVPHLPADGLTAVPNPTQ
jgi:hypothetical protein